MKLKFLSLFWHVLSVFEAMGGQVAVIAAKLAFAAIMAQYANYGAFIFVL